MVAPFLASETRTEVRIADNDAPGAPQPGDLLTVSSSLGGVLTDELYGARRSLGIAVQEILLAALGGAVARTVGEGEVRVDFVTSTGTVLHVGVTCADQHGGDANQTLVAIRRALATAPRPDHGDHAAVRFRYLGNASGETADAGWTAGLALDLVARRRDGVLVLEWRYDARRFFPATVEELAEQFPLALIALTSEAVPPIYGARSTDAVDRSYARR